MIQLHSLKVQLENLKGLLDEYIAAGKSREEIVKMIHQIKEVEKLIEQRREFLRRNQSPN